MERRTIKEWIAWILVDVVWKFVIKNVDPQVLETMLRQRIEEWCQKHINPEEIIAEGNDVMKWLKEKL